MGTLGLGGQYGGDIPGFDVIFWWGKVVFLFASYTPDL